MLMFLANGLIIISTKSTNLHTCLENNSDAESCDKNKRICCFWSHTWINKVFNQLNLKSYSNPVAEQIQIVQLTSSTIYYKKQLKRIRPGDSAHQFNFSTTIRLSGITFGDNWLQQKLSIYICTYYAPRRCQDRSLKKKSICMRLCMTFSILRSASVLLFYKSVPAMSSP